MKSTYQSTQWLTAQKLRRVSLGILLAGGFLISSCGKKNVTTSASDMKGGDPESKPSSTDRSSGTPGENAPKTAAKGAPVPVPEALATPRTQFQSRSDLTLPIATYDLQSGDWIRLKQKNSDITIFSIELPDGFGAASQEGLARYLREERDYALANASAAGKALGYQVMIRLVPRVLLADRKLNYGTNDLNLTLETPSLDREASRAIVIKDFQYFTLGTSVGVGEKPMQRSTSYQGRTSWVVGNIVRSSKVDLSVGSIGILNR